MMNTSLVEGFEWDKGNARKSTDKHAVFQSEAEQVFFNQPLLLMPDPKHSQQELRYHALGVTDDMRKLHITFTFRSNGRLIRIISARPMHRNERRIYEQNESNP